MPSLPRSQHYAPEFHLARFQLSSRILQFKKCEALIYVPLPHIARFIGEPSVEVALDNLFGDSSWKAARTAKGKSAELILHELPSPDLTN